MAQERITAWLRVRDKLRFIRDMREAARSVDEMGDAEERAALKAKLFGREQRRAGISAAALKDHLSLTRGELMTTAITASIYLAPALLAVGNSAVAAAVGGGAVAGGGLSALLVGLGGFAIVGAQAVQQLTKVKTAQDAYNLAILQYGQGSKQAADASAKLWAVVQQNGGMQVLRLAWALDALKKSWRAATAPARASFFSLMSSGINSARGLLPTFAAETNKNAAVIRRDMSDLFSGISGPETKANIKVFSSIFRNMSPHLTGGLLNLFLVLGRVLRQAAPWAVTWAESFERTTKAWEVGTRDGIKLGDTIDMLVGHTQAWWGLIKAVGGVLLTLFSASNQSGKGLIVSLTAVVTKFDQWLQAAERTGKVTSFFNEFADATREIARLLTPILVIVGTLATGMLPVLRDSSGQVNDALWIMAANVHLVVAAIQFLGPLVGPLIDLWIAWRFATMAETAAMAVATVVVGVMMGELWAILLVIGLVAAGFYLLYTRVGWFHNAVDATARFIKENWPGVVATLALGPVGTALYLMYKKFEWFRNGISAVFHFIADRIRDFINFMKRVPGAIGGGGGGLLGKIGKGVLKHLPGIGPFAGAFAAGGIIPHGTVGVVGEAGPELAVSGSTGTAISPLKSTGQVDLSPSIDPEVFVRNVITLKADRRVIAKLVDDTKADKKARRGER